MHKAGAWFLAVFFVVFFVRRAAITPGMYWPHMALIFAAIIIRLVAARRNSRIDAV